MSRGLRDALTKETSVLKMSDAAYGDAVDFRRPVQDVIPGVQGRILPVLADTTAELNLRTVARLAGVSHGYGTREVGST
jgi:hypothetical protein